MRSLVSCIASNMKIIGRTQYVRNGSLNTCRIRSSALAVGLKALGILPAPLTDNAREQGMQNRIY